MMKEADETAIRIAANVRAMMRALPAVAERCGYFM
jgi:hypothetical protein